ncbi:MAG TPA: enoyl-CoA hydratase-related protein, partial [Lentzea sp.]
IWDSPKPVVCQVNGSARAGGIGLIAACDIALAAQQATFAFSEVRIGVVPAVISVTVLPRLLPRQAHELFLTGETFDSHRAKEIGLLNSAVPVDGVDAEVRRYTDMLALGAPNALAATKEMLRQERSANLGEVFADMLELSAQHFGGPEGQEGIAAFKEKRRPSWVPPQD